jgi:hypothetical protein
MRLKMFKKIIFLVIFLAANIINSTISADAPYQKTPEEKIKTITNFSNTEQAVNELKKLLMNQKERITEQKNILNEELQDLEKQSWSLFSLVTKPSESVIKLSQKHNRIEEIKDNDEKMDKSIKIINNQLHILNKPLTLNPINLTNQYINLENEKIDLSYKLRIHHFETGRLKADKTFLTDLLQKQQSYIYTIETKLTNLLYKVTTAIMSPIYSPEDINKSLEYFILNKKLLTDVEIAKAKQSLEEIERDKKKNEEKILTLENQLKQKNKNIESILQL